MEPIKDMQPSTHSRYSLVVASAKRARQLINGATPRVEVKNHKPVTIALEEIKAGKVKWFSTKDGIK